MPGATVTAAAQAQLFAAGAGVEYTSISDSDGYTVYAARAVGTLRRRAAQPLPTGSCGIGKTTCPDLSGGFRCVDVRTDIFSKASVPLRQFEDPPLTDPDQTAAAATLALMSSKSASTAPPSLTAMFSVSLDNAFPGLLRVIQLRHLGFLLQ